MHAAKIIAVSILLLGIFAVDASAHHPVADAGPSQAGPLRTLSPQTLPAGKAAFSVQYEYFDFDSFSDRELRAFAAAGSDVHSTDSVTHIYLLGSFGLTDNFTLSVKMPYVILDNIREAHADEPDEVHAHGDSKGVGDFTLFGQYRFLNGADYQGAVIVGIDTPTGRTGVVDVGNERFETEFQPGSGSWDPSIAAAFQRGFGNVSLHTSLGYTFVTEGSQDTNLGDIFHYNAAVCYGIPYRSVSWLLALEMNGEFRQKQEVSGISDPNSGGHLLLLSPGVRMRWERLSAFVSAGFPVIQDFNGIQTDLNYTIITGLNVMF